MARSDDKDIVKWFSFTYRDKMLSVSNWNHVSDPLRVSLDLLFKQE